ncbi:MAG TPA: hypothetical protein VIF62_15145 [Labilithrix sp.]|jgi:hypothetical protein
MINGAHVILYSSNADADRAFFRDTLKYRHADAGHGWLIFALPPAEVAMHPTDGSDKHELYLMCENVDAFVADMEKKGVPTGSIHEERWGRLTQITLPSGSKLGVYEPRHASPVVKPKKKSAPKAKPKKKAAAKAKRRKT